MLMLMLACPLCFDSGWSVDEVDSLAMLKDLRLILREMNLESMGRSDRKAECTKRIS